MQWVSVDERLPAKSGRFLVAGKSMANCDYFDAKTNSFIGVMAVKWWANIPDAPDGTNFTKRGLYQATHNKGAKKKTEFPYNFYEELTGNNAFVLPEDWEETVEHFWSRLDERTRIVLELLYKNGLNMKATSEQMGITRQRVQQIKADALRKMKHDGTMQILLSGLKKAQDNYDATLKMLEAGELEAALEKVGIINNSVNEVGGISVRGRRVLREQGIGTLGELAKCEFKKMVAWPSCGVTTAKNVTDALRDYVLAKSYGMG